MPKLNWFNLKQDFAEKLQTQEISQDDISFIKETLQIFARGYFFGGQVGEGGSTVDISTIIQTIYPVGSIYISVNNVNPTILFGGVWEPIEDVFLLACGKRPAGEIGGEETHQLTVGELPAHTHQYKRHSLNREDTDPETGQDAYGVSNKTLDERIGTSEMTGGDQPHNNMPPYLTVYMWKRVN